MTPPPGWRYEPSEVILDIQIQKYARLAAMAVVFYDTIITLDREVKFFWGRPWSHIKFIYVLNRYWGTIALAVDTWVVVSKIRTDAMCKFQFIFQNWSVLLSMLLVEVILMIRVHALFDRTRKALLFLASLLLVQLSFMTALLVALQNILVVEAYGFGWICGSSELVPRWFALFWLPTVLVDLILLSLTLYKALSFAKMSPHKSLSGSRLFETLVRDQVLYFIGILGVSAANMVAVSFMPLLICVALGFVLGFPLIMGSRLLLNLREMAEEEVKGKTTVLSALVFLPGQAMTLRTQQQAQTWSSSTLWV